MSSQKTRAITLRITDYRETSQIVAVYSRDFGRLSFVAKGSKRKRAGSQGTLDLFQLIDLVFIEKSEAALQLLIESSLIEDFAGLRRDLRRGYAAFFIAELLLGLTEEHDPSPPVFDLLAATLKRLCETERPDVALYAFEARLLQLIGLLPRLACCAVCGGELKTDGEVAFSAGQGGTLCPKCESSIAEKIHVSRGAVAVLNKLTTASPINLERLRISATISKDVRKMLARLWMHLMGREPRMLKYLS